jgi:hypothetical protein
MQSWLPSVVGITISLLSLTVSIAAFRYSRAKHLAGFPYIEAARLNALQPDAVDWGIVGPDRENWEATSVQGEGTTRLLKSEPYDNGHEVIARPVNPHEELLSIDRPQSPLFVAADKGGTLTFHLRSKANPAMKTRRTVKVPRQG